jgi:hypothetical protein
MFTKRIWISILSILVLAAAGQAQLLPKLVTGTVKNPDSSQPAEDEWEFTAMLTSDPSDTTQPDSCADGGGWGLNLYDFDAQGTAWSPGDTLIVMFENITSGPFANTSYQLQYVTTNDDVQYTGDITLPVELTTFQSEVEHNLTGSRVVLNWHTMGESNNFGFDIEKSHDGNSFEKIGFVSGAGSTQSAQSYTFTDTDVEVGVYHYRLKQIDTDGSLTYSETLQVQVTPPKTYALGQNYPNPFNPETRIAFQLKNREQVTIKVFDVLGRNVRTLVDQTLEAGTHQITFDAGDLPSGLYLYSMRAGEFHQVRKMALVK